MTTELEAIIDLKFPFLQLYCFHCFWSGIANLFASLCNLAFQFCAFLQKMLAILLCFCLCGDLGDGLLMGRKEKCDLKTGKALVIQSSPYSFPFRFTLLYRFAKLLIICVIFLPKLAFFFLMCLCICSESEAN